MTLLYLNSDQMGNGDPELGQKLLLSFLEKLAASDIQVDMVGCVNSGVKLTTEGSKALEALQALQQKGARIASCGTCLDHYQVRDKLLIGEVGNMEQSVQILSTAERIIRV